MGLFDFVKNAGEKVFGKDDDKEAPKPRAAGGATDQASLDRWRAARLVKVVERTGIGVDDLSVNVQGDTAKVSGRVNSQAEREKVVLAVGNVEGIARVDDRLEVEKEEPQATFYTVKKGDTLSKIAQQHYGNAGKYQRIFEANRPLLEDPDEIYPGQVLRIPQSG